MLFLLLLCLTSGIEASLPGFEDLSACSPDEYGKIKCKFPAYILQDCTSMDITKYGTFEMIPWTYTFYLQPDDDESYYAPPVIVGKVLLDYQKCVLDSESEKLKEGKEDQTISFLYVPDRQDYYVWLKDSKSYANDKFCAVYSGGAMWRDSVSFWMFIKGKCAETAEWDYYCSLNDCEGIVF